MPPPVFPVPYMEPSNTNLYVTYYNAVAADYNGGQLGWPFVGSPNDGPFAVPPAFKYPVRVMSGTTQYPYRGPLQLPKFYTDTVLFLYDDTNGTNAIYVRNFSWGYEEQGFLISPWP